MTDLVQLAKQHANLPERDQKKAGQAIGGAMDDEHNQFLKKIKGMLQSGDIDYLRPETIFRKDQYDALTETDRSKVDLAMVNIVDLLRHISDFYLSKKTPDESPHLETMIEQLWQMKAKVEGQYGRVFKF